MTEKKEKLSFEEALSRLEDASDKLRSKNITLEDSVKLYNESVEYYEACLKILDGAKQKIEIINPDSGEVQNFEQ